MPLPLSLSARLLPRYIRGASVKMWQICSFCFVLGRRGVGSIVGRARASFVQTSRRGSLKFKVIHPFWVALSAASSFYGWNGSATIRFHPTFLPISFGVAKRGGNHVKQSWRQGRPRKNVRVAFSGILSSHFLPS